MFVLTHTEWFFEVIRVRGLLALMSYLGRSSKRDTELAGSGFYSTVPVVMSNKLES